MENVIPRWEYRVFGEAVGRVETAIRAHACTRILDSAEDYVLCRTSEVNVKVRGGLLDVKRLETVNDDGLELWCPVSKVGFPCPASDIVAIFLVFGLPRPELPQATYSYDRFIDEAVAACPDLTVVRVVKRRHGFIVRDTFVEIAELTMDGRDDRTAAVEHADPRLALDIARELGLTAHPNLNYVEALKRSLRKEAV